MVYTWTIRLLLLHFFLPAPSNYNIYILPFIKNILKTLKIFHPFFSSVPQTDLHFTPSLFYAIWAFPRHLRRCWREQGTKEEQKKREIWRKTIVEERVLSTQKIFRTNVPKYIYKPRNVFWNCNVPFNQ